MYNFDYHKPASLDEALALLKDSDDAMVISGGMTLLPTMKQRLASPSALIDLSGISNLSGITLSGNTLTIGAMTCHADVATSADVQKAIPALSHLAGHIGDPQVRNRGTIGGSVANADPAADYPAAVLGLNATIETNTRKIAADDFFVDLFETALDEGEIVTAVHFAVPDQAGYAKFENPASGYAMVGVMVAKYGSDVRVAVTGAGPSAFRAADMEAALAKNFSPDALGGISVSADGLNSDMHASAAYRAHLVTVMAQRAVAAA
ncbi:MAG: xanthine dehydrogenase family protein subunit M [Rhodospirillaceae bacterium]|jgi:carbon-monoxide dehydrogenase medium subunit